MGGRTDAVVARGVRVLSTILITGASGQVGCALVGELVRRGAKPRAMVRTEQRADGLAQQPWATSLSPPRMQ